MKLNKEDKKFIRGLLNDARPMYEKAMEHLRLTDPKEYARLQEIAARPLSCC